MKLRYSSTSPFVRKVMVTALETGQGGDIEQIPTAPWAPDTDLPAVNPTGKVPALQADNGAWLFDSWVICEYLDGRHTGPKLTPESGDARVMVLRGHAMANAATDAGVLRLLEGRRAENERSSGWMERQTVAMGRILDAMDGEADSGVLKGDLNMAQIAAGCALGWFDFRFTDDNWRGTRPALAEFYDGLSNRPSFLQTAPKEPSS
ncbi:MAG: glutathione S-transferase N-terminal domain-containing protein [Rhodospirillales bacterium]